MPKIDDRHKGIRIDTWFSFEEHDEMVKAMSDFRIDNRSDFIRSAVKSFIVELRKAREELNK